MQLKTHVAPHVFVTWNQFWFSVMILEDYICVSSRPVEFFSFPSASRSHGLFIPPWKHFQSNTTDGQIKQISFYGEMSHPHAAKSNPALRIYAVTLSISQFSPQGSRTSVAKQGEDEVCWLLQTFSWEDLLSTMKGAVVKQPDSEQ